MVGDKNKTKKQLIDEIGELRRQISKPETERKQAEDKLRRSEASLAEAQRIAHIGSWELDLISNTLTWSDEVYRMFGLEPQQFGATYEAFLDNIHPDDREMVDKVYTESVRSKTPYDIVHRLLLKDGTVKYVNERCETFYDNEKPIRSIGTVQDITERKRNEERIWHLNAALRALRNVNQLITREKDRDSLIQRSCDLLVESRGYTRAWVLLVDKDRNFVSAAGAGTGKQLSILMKKLRKGKYPPCVNEVLEQEQSIAIYDDVSSQCQECHLAGSHRQRSAFMGRLEYDGKVCGMIAANIPSELSSDKEEQGLFRELTGDIAFALYNMEKEEQRKQSEEQLKQTKEHLQLQIDRMPIGLIVWDTEFRAQTWNPSAEKIFGFTAEEVLGKHSYDLIVPKEAQPHVDNIWRRLLKGDTTAHSINENITKDGQTIICDWTNTPLKKADGTLIGVLSMVQDITEHEQVEVALRKSEERYRDLFDNANDLIQSVTGDGHFLYVNQAWQNVLGYSEEETHNLNIWDIIHPDSKSHCIEMFQKVMSGEAVSNMEAVFVAKDGSPISVEGNAHCLFEDGKPVATQGIFRDATERKQTEETLKQAAAEWRTTFDAIHDWIFICDKDFRIIRVNKAFAGALGKNPRGLIGKSCYKLVHGTDTPRLDCPHQRTLELKRPVRDEFFEPYLGIHMEVSCSPIFDKRGGISAVVHIIRDVTERKKMEEQLIVTDRLASIGELASGIAHELNNPLTSVIGFSDLLMGKDVPDDIKEDLKIIGGEAHRAAGIVKNLLAFARKHPREKQSVDINKAIQTILDLRAYEQRVSNIEVNTHFASDLPEILADGFQLQQVFLNIVINAEHFMIKEHGRGTLTITTERAGDIIRVSFTDDGPGIPGENLGHLFDPFFTTKEVGKGTGLGLSICHGIIAEHGGRIYAESELGKGATFVVELPISQ